MEESILAVYDDVKFVERVTKLTGKNWRSYFGSFLQNGVLAENYPVRIGNDGKIRIYDCSICANGTIGKLESEDGYIEIPINSSNTETDEFICARMYFESENLEIVAKKGIAQSKTSYSDQSKEYIQQFDRFARDESYMCVRNDEYWEIPLAYRTKQYYTGTTYNCFSHGYPLARDLNIDKPKSYILSGAYSAIKRIEQPIGLYSDDDFSKVGITTYPLVVSGNNSYCLYDSTDTTTIKFDVINPPRNAIVRILNGGTSSPISISIPRHQLAYATASPIQTYCNSIAVPSDEGWVSDTNNYTLTLSEWSHYLLHINFTGYGYSSRGTTYQKYCFDVSCKKYSSAEFIFGNATLPGWAG